MSEGKINRRLMIVGAAGDGPDLGDRLARAGFEVIEPSDPREAIAAHNSLDPSILIAGPSFDGMDRAAFLGELAACPLPPPLVIVAAEWSAGADWAGFREHVRDPEDEDSLLDALDRAFRFRALQWETWADGQELREARARLEASDDQSRRDARTVRDIAEAELRYREAFAAAGDAIFMVRPDGTILDANASAATLSGVSRKNLLGANVADLGPASGRDETADFLGRAVGSAIGIVEDHPIVTPDGRSKVISVSAVAVDFGGNLAVNLICRDVTELRAQAMKAVEYARELEESCQTKDVQLSRSQAQLIQSERLAMLGRMLAGMAHEIRTPLGAINGNNDVLEAVGHEVREQFQRLVAEHPELAAKCERASECLDDTIRTNRMASERLLAIVKSTRSFARSEESGMRSVDLNEGLEDSLVLATHELKNRIEVVREFGELPEIECYPSQINQVFLNLIVNASQAIEGRGSIRIRTWIQEDTVRVAVSDTGVGISPEVRDRIFDLGFTTKEAGQGSGLGLSICNAIIQQNHGGSIEVETAPGKGSTFTVILPRDRTIE